MTNYTGKGNQTIFDVAIQTYGGMDNLLKLCVDSGIDNMMLSSYFGDEFDFDETKIVNKTISDYVSNNNIIFATGSPSTEVVFSEEDDETVFVSEDGGNEFTEEK